MTRLSVMTSTSCCKPKHDLGCDDFLAFTISLFRSNLVLGIGIFIGGPKQSVAVFASCPGSDSFEENLSHAGTNSCPYIISEVRGTRQLV